MGCYHCMSDCTPNNKHMDFETLHKVIEAANKIHPLTLVISGGEPFEHPECIKMMSYIIQHSNAVAFMIATNGRLLARTKEYQDFVNSLGQNVIVQVTDDPRYYPDPLATADKAALKTIKIRLLIDGVNNLVPLGRALENYPDFDYTKTTKAPKCTNARLMLAQGLTDLAEMTKAMTAHGKYCFPYIGYDGSVRPGESLLCPSLGYIWEPEVVVKHLAKLRCKKCKIALKIAMSNPLTAIYCRQVF